MLLTLGGYCYLYVPERGNKPRLGQMGGKAEAETLSSSCEQVFPFTPTEFHILTDFGSEAICDLWYSVSASC